LFRLLLLPPPLPQQPDSVPSFLRVIYIIFILFCSEWRTQSTKDK